MTSFHARLAGARALLVLALLFWPRASWAQGLATMPGAGFQSPLGSPPGARWSTGRDRWFVSGRIDAGFLFLRPRVSAGYGRPHYDWIGLDLVPTVAFTAAGGYAGARMEGRFLQIRTGLLYQYSFNRSYLPAAPSYDLRDLDVLDGPRASYFLWDSEADLYFPLGSVRLRYQIQPVVADGIPEDHALYLDNLRVVAGPGITLRQRAGVEFFWPGTTIGISPEVEIVWLEARSSVVVRAGGTCRWLLSDEFEVRTAFLPVWSSPDQLGRASGDVLEFALRWRWATSEGRATNSAPRPRAEPSRSSPGDAAAP